MTGTPTAPAVDTDRVLLEFPDGKGARLLVTESGALGIDVGGHVVVRPVEVWHALALSAQSPPNEPAELPASDWLEDLIEMAQEHADQFASAYAGYKPSRHAYYAEALRRGRAALKASKEASATETARLDEPRNQALPQEPAESFKLKGSEVDALNRAFLKSAAPSAAQVNVAAQGPASASPGAVVPSAAIPAAATPAPEPVAWMAPFPDNHLSTIRRVGWTPLYTQPPEVREALRKCWCESCDMAVNTLRSRMSVCPQCGDKRCPRAAHHDNECRSALSKGDAK